MVASLPVTKAFFKRHVPSLLGTRRSKVKEISGPCRRHGDWSIACRGMDEPQSPQNFGTSVKIYASHVPSAIFNSHSATRLYHKKLDSKSHLPEKTTFASESATRPSYQSDNRPSLSNSTTRLYSGHYDFAPLASPCEKSTFISESAIRAHLKELNLSPVTPPKGRRPVTFDSTTSTLRDNQTDFSPVTSPLTSPCENRPFILDSPTRLYHYSLDLTRPLPSF